jgi:hypothetical protein
MAKMKGTHRRIRSWIVLAVVVASLGLVSSASARYLPEDSGSAAPVTMPVVDVTSNDGFNWGDALIGAGVAVGAAAALGGAAYLARTRSRLAI